MMIAAGAVLVSCNMDFYSSDTMTSAMLKENPGAAVYTTDGNYSMFYQHLDYVGYGGNTYSRLLFLMTELRGDNVALSGRTTDPLYQNVTYTDNPTLTDLQYFWFASYKIIYGANSNIESIPVGVDAATDHLLGENYFIRAIAHLNLCNVFATPYTYGAEKRPDMPGVVLRNSTDCSVTVRATVGEVYEQIVADLQKAMELMKDGKRRGNAGYASYNAAAGLLTRVYLYMGEYDKCIELAEAMFDGNPAANLDDITTYFPNTRTSKETLWCIAKDNDDEGADYSPKSQLASMYFSPDAIGGTGWCEMYWSDPLMELIFRHPEDKRLAMWGQFDRSNDHKLQIENDPTCKDLKMIHYPIIDPANNFRLNANINMITGFDMDADENKITVKKYTYRQMKDEKGELVFEEDKNGNKNPVMETVPVEVVGADGKLTPLLEANGDKVFVYEDSLTNHVVYRTLQNGYPVYYMKGLYTDAEDNDGFEGGTRVYVRDNVGIAQGIRQTFPAYTMAKFSWQDGDAMLSSPAVIRWAEVVLNAAEAYAHKGNTAKALEYTNVIRTRAGIPTWTEAGYISEGYTDIVDVVLDERRLELCFEGHRAIDVFRNGKVLDRRFAGVHDWEEIDKAEMDKRFPYCIPFAEISVSGIAGNGKQ